MNSARLDDMTVALANPDDGATARIVDAAYHALSVDGIRRTTMNQIADAAGVGVATVYRRFPQKTQLVRAVVLREAARVTVAVATAMEATSSVEMQAADGFTAFADAITDRPLLVRLLRGDNEGDGGALSPGELIDSVISMARDYIAGWIRAIQAQGRYQSVDADIVAEIEARLALSLVLAPNGRIPMHDRDAITSFAAKYLVPLLGPEH